MNNFFSTLDSVRQEIIERLTDAKAVLAEEGFFSDCLYSFPSGVSYGDTREHHLPLALLNNKPTKKYAHAVVYRMPSGNYELTFYIL